MRHTPWPTCLALLWMGSMPAMAADNGASALREADAAWVRAARTGSVDAWLSFYADDALVLPPNESQVSGREAIRHTIAELLGLPQLVIDWQPTRIEMSAAGDLGAVAGTYMLQYRDSAGALVSDRGKLLEVWRRQADGSWRCIIDTWNSDLAAPVAAEPAPSAPPPVAAPSSAPATPAAPVDYGDAPEHYEAAIREHFRHVLVNPSSLRIGEIGKPQHGSLADDGLFVRHPGLLYGWTVTATVDAQTSWGAYTGLKTYTFLFRGEKLLKTAAPPAEGEMK